MVLLIQFFILFFLVFPIGEHVNSGDEVAIKLESIKSKHPQLLYESKLYKILAGGSKL